MPRPSAAANIVDPQSIIRMPNRTDTFSLVQLSQFITDKNECLRWLASRGLLKNNMNCVCGNPFRLNSRASNIDGKVWSCGPCRRRKSVHDGSFFYQSHLSLSQLTIFIYCWSCDVPQTFIQHQAGIGSDHTMVDWSNNLREECEAWLENNPDEIGGVDDNGDPIIVEIDENKFFHRKYHRGQWREGHWPLGLWGNRKKLRKMFFS